MKTLAILASIAGFMVSVPAMANPFAGTYKSDACTAKGNYFYQVEEKITVGDLDHFGQITESVVEYLDKECEIETDERKSTTYDYTLYPTSRKGIYEFNVYQLGKEKISFYDIITKGKYRGKTYIFFGRGGPAKTEARRPRARDINRRFRQVKGSIEG